MLIPNNERVRIEPLYDSGQDLYSDPFNSLANLLYAYIFFRKIFLLYNEEKK